MNTIRRARQIKARNDKGVGVIGLVVTLVILSIIAAIGGPPLWRLITDANEAKLNSHLEQASEAVRTRFRLKPELLTPGDAATGAMKPELRDDLTAEWGVPWLDWPGTFDAADGDDQTFYVQAINQDPSHKPPIATAAPIYPFIAKPGGAWRILTYNDDGAWACALIVQLPKVSDTQANQNGNFVGAKTGRITAGSDIVTAVHAWMVGEWYDRGERLLDANGMNSVCSPVIALDDNTKPQSSLPTGVSTWPVGNTGAAMKAANDQVKQVAVTGSETWPDASTVDPAKPWRTMTDRL